MARMYGGMVVGVVLAVCVGAHGAVRKQQQNCKQVHDGRLRTSTITPASCVTPPVPLVRRVALAEQKLAADNSIGQGQRSVEQTRDVTKFVDDYYEIIAKYQRSRLYPTRYNGSECTKRAADADKAKQDKCKFEKKLAQQSKNDTSPVKQYLALLSPLDKLIAQDSFRLQGITLVA